jgi:hypothetical protein
MGELKLPVLIQWGELDRWIPLSDAHGFQRGIAGAELRVYPGAGHVPMEELPEATARDADAFLGPPARDSCRSETPHHDQTVLRSMHVDGRSQLACHP